MHFYSTINKIVCLLSTRDIERRNRTLYGMDNEIGGDCQYTF